MDRRSRYLHGTPIEEAPLWMLALLTALLWLVLFPALVGFLDAARLFDGDLRSAAAWAFLLAVALVLGLALRKPWRRPRPDSAVDERPLFVRFSTWLITALAVPNVLHGVMVITHGGRSIDPRGALLFGILVAILHGFFALIDRWQRRTGRRRGCP